mmetsp:Transcript_29923/g.53126  ORF Transcript_29923/g.53126 Transcript_29923/m.53126 type:complete len:132 (-) Transcript_29923:150-545(-)
MSGLVHSLGFLMLMGVYAFICLRYRVLSIPRLNSLHNLVLLNLIICYVALVLHIEAYKSPIVWCTGGSLSVLACCTVFWLTYRKLPKLNPNPQTISTEALFKFAFRPSSTLMKDGASYYQHTSNLSSYRTT